MNKNIVLSHIRKTSIKHLVISVVPLLIIFIIFALIPFKELFWSDYVNTASEALKAHQNGSTFITVTPEVIYYTGYDLMEDRKSKGAYYYEIQDDNKCVFYLMNESEDIIENKYRDTGILVKFKKSNGLFDNMLEMLSKTIDWNYDGLKEITSDTILVQIDNVLWLYQLVFIILLMVILYLLYIVINNFLYSIFPILHPAVRKIKRFCNYDSYKALSEDLDYQVITDVAHAGGMYITENFFIHLGSFYVNIVPLSEVVFVYKNSQIKSLSKMHFKILYNLHLIGNRRFRCTCPGKTKEDTDFILDYFANNYPDILNGYTDENRRFAIYNIRKRKKENRLKNKKSKKKK